VALEINRWRAKNLPLPAIQYPTLIYIFNLPYLILACRKISTGYEHHYDDYYPSKEANEIFKSVT
jgi:hypothetical protein